MLHNMPVVDDLLRHFPDAQIDWVVEEAYVNLVRLHPGVRHIIPSPYDAGARVCARPQHAQKSPVFTASYGMTPTI
jgi:ADP-heptose:LPS heptosyltransferase